MTPQPAEPGTFILRQVVRDVLLATDKADPGDVAGLVLERIPVGLSRIALAQALRLFVRQVISETRTGNNPPMPTPINRSVKVSAIRDGWQRRLRDRVHVGAAEWKLLKLCTHDDLVAAAAERRVLAERNQAWARQYDEWASAVLQAGVETFGDLSPEVQMHLLGRAA